MKAKIWTPGEDGFKLSVVEDYICSLAADYQIQAVAYDPWNFMVATRLRPPADGI